MTFDEWYGDGPDIPNHDPSLRRALRAEAHRAWDAATDYERERLSRCLEDVIAACESDLATGHLPSSFDPVTRKRECQMLLAILREGA